jgi:hypothetical protein
MTRVHAREFRSEAIRMRPHAFLVALGFLCIIADPSPGQDRKTKVLNDRKAFEGSRDWIYNDLTRAIRVSKETHKPLMVVFRCIPCEACQKFDDDVARRDPIIRDLLDQFVCVRIPQANAMDLSHFQFDFDLSFAVFFTDSDLTIYGRFGTRSGRPEEEDISLQGLRKAMAEALRMHKSAETIKPTLTGKQVKASRFATPRDFPELAGRYKAELDYDGTVVQSCIHCHQIRDAERRLYRASRERFPDHVLYPYPDPEVVGLKLDPAQMATIERVESDSSAALDGFRRGDEIVSLDGQPLLSIADFEWVLHNAPATAKLPAEVRRGGKTLSLILTLNNGWRRGGLSWRTTSWMLRQMAFGGMKIDSASDQERRQASVPPDRMALKVAYVGQHGEHAIAKRAGFERGDVIVSFDGKDAPVTESDLFDYTLRQKHPGDTVAVTVLRNGTRKTLTYTLP